MVKGYDNILFGNFSELADQFSNLTDTFLQPISEMLANYLGMARSLLNKYLDFNKIVNRNSTYLSSLPWNTIDQAAKIVPATLKGVAIGIAAVLFLVCLLNLLGMILGPVCVKKSPKTSQRIYLASSQISLSTGPMLCILAILLFIVGTPTYREFCFDVRKGSESEYFNFADRVLLQQLPNFTEGIKISENVSIRLNTSRLFLITKTIETDCKNNDSLTKVLFDVVIIDNSTLDGITSMIMPAIKGFTDRFNFSNLPAFKNETVELLRRTAIAIGNQTIALPFNGSIQLLYPDLEAIKVSMEAAKNETGVNSTYMETLISTDLDRMNKTAVKISEVETKLFREIEETKILLTNVSQLLLLVANKSLEAREGLENVTTDALVNGIQVVLKDAIWEFYYSTRAKLNETAKCRPLYDFFDSIFAFFCDSIVDPMNSYWFSLGISIALLIPSFLTGLWLGGLMARRHKAFDDYVDDDDDEEEEWQKDKTVPDGNQPTNQSSRLGKPTQALPPLPAPVGAGDAGKASRRTPRDGAPYSDFENASLYYIPAFPNAQQSRTQPDYRPSDPYYNFPYLRSQQPSAGNGKDIRFPRPWRSQVPGQYGFSPYQRF